MNKRRLLYYCEGCEELCCEYCLETGPHNNSLHVVDYLICYHDKKSKIIREIDNREIG